MAGPCVIEGETVLMRTAETLVNLCAAQKIPLIFKSSYRKANRTRSDSFNGIGDETALKLLKKAGETFGVPTVTDIHETDEAAMAAEYVDVLQIPAFLCRQSDLLMAAARTNKIVNVKKGQFLSPEAMRFAVDKIRLVGNEQVILTERGNSFGYQDLIVDYRGIPKMKEMQVPIVMDCTHSLQQPNQSSGITGGDPKMIETIARAAIAVGADGLFIETHPDPANAKSDGANMLPLVAMEKLLNRLCILKEAVNAMELL